MEDNKEFDDFCAKHKIDRSSPDYYEFKNWAPEEMEELKKYEIRPFNKEFWEDGVMPPEPEETHIPVCYYLVNALSNFRY